MALHEEDTGPGRARYVSVNALPHLGIFHPCRSCLDSISLLLQQRYREDVVMKGHSTRVIVVKEDAYKQNTVYRPWSDIISHKSDPVAENSGQDSRPVRLARRAK